jgi:hypothetical protein
MQERRHHQRRGDGQPCHFPFLCDDGEMIATDRRLLPDRRLENISVEEISYEDFISELSRIS